MRSTRRRPPLSWSKGACGPPTRRPRRCSAGHGRSAWARRSLTPRRSHGGSLTPLSRSVWCMVADGRGDGLVVRGRVVLEDRVLEDGEVVVRDGRIKQIREATPVPREPAAGLHADPPVRSAAWVLPGLVDIHCHGGGGASFPDARTLDEVLPAVAEHLQHGTTSLVASLV